MSKSKKLLEFLKNQDFTMSKSKLNGSILIIKDKKVIFKLWHDNTLFFKEKSWSINYYKNSELKKCNRNVGGMGAVIKRLNKAILSRNKAIKVTV